MPLDTALIASVRLILDDPEYDVTWQDRRTGWRDAGGHVSILPLSVLPRGVDEKRVDATTGQERIYGVRNVRVQVTCETDDQDPGSDAMDLAETLAAGFHRTDVEALLDAADLGGVVCQPRRVVNYPDKHGDQRSAAVFEVWLNTHRTHLGAILDTVGSVEYGGEVADETGAVALVVGPTTVFEDD